ncbi:MAG TPA: inositol monophosphatase family protein [Pirellulales bacterium]|nr:inositol monophosphatase family protein [Pirellulales bacterium]
MATIDDYQRVCEKAARAGADVLRDWAGRFAVREKGPADLVTEADLASQEVIRRVLLGAFPRHGFLAEEPFLANGTASIASQEDGLRWIVDPLDGTTNYVHGVPNYAVSIALEQAGELLVGTVYDPAADECFSAALGMGATCNGRRLHVSGAQCLSQALVAVSFSAQVRRGDREINDFLEVMLQAQATRRMGSSALNLCYVAAGRFDAYWATTTKTWDIAAGAILVREAGGVINSFDGGTLDLERPQFIAAATPALQHELHELLHRRC